MKFVGFAISQFHIPPDAAWDMTIAEFWAAYDFIHPEDEGPYVAPFSDDEKAVFEEIRKRKGYIT